MLKEKTVVVIGGSQGIGFAIAQEALQAGAKVVIGSRSQDKLDKALNKLNSPHAKAFTIDTTNKKSIESFFQKVGTFDHLQIPASTLTYKSFMDMSEEEARQSMENKFWGPFNVIKSALNSINPTGSSITLFSGSASKRPLPGKELLSAMNGAVEGLAKSLAISLHPIRINTIAPGIIQTPVLDKFSPDNLDKMVEPNVIQRLGKPEEIAQGSLFLMSNEYMTGQTLFINGGFTLG